MTRTTLLALAERVEAATGADRELDVLVALAKGWRKESARDWFTPPGVNVRHHKTELPCYTASLDAAMSLPPSGQAQEVLRHAMAALGKRFDLHIKFWPKDQNYTEWLARFVTAASLRAIAGSLPND